MKQQNVDILLIKKRSAQTLELLQTDPSLKNISRSQASAEKPEEIIYPHAQIRADIKMSTIEDIERVEQLLNTADKELSTVKNNDFISNNVQNFQSNL